MTQITVDDAMLEQLRPVAIIEFIDASDSPKGKFIPFIAYYRGKESPITTEELKRRMAHKGRTYTTKEVMDHLRQLEISGPPRVRIPLEGTSLAPLLGRKEVVELRDGRGIEVGRFVPTEHVESRQDGL